MILHLLSDDKFTDYAITQFETVAPGKNKYLIINYREEDSCKYVKQVDKTQMIAEGSDEFLRLCQSLEQFSAIITHNLSTPAQAKIITSAPGNVRIGWVFWGFEIYSRKENVHKYLGRHSFRINAFFQVKRWIRKGLRLIQLQPAGKNYYQVPVEVFSRVHFCLTDLEEDFKVAKKFLKIPLKMLWYNYYNIDETLGNLKDKNISGENIFVGNSATLSNNHIEVFKRLRTFNIHSKKVFVPLSYGSQGYAGYIAKKGAACLGDNFSPLTEFIERDIYNRLIRSCSVVIMNHYRHQAMGNIITALWLGARVYLSKKASTFSYFKRLGAHIFSVEDDLHPSNPHALDPLPGDLVTINRNILAAEYGRENILSKVKIIVDTLN